MKRVNIKGRIICILMSVCLIMQMLPTLNNVRAADPEAKWTKYTGNNAYKNGTVTEDATGLTLESAASKMAAAYYTQKVTVEEGTKISMDVTIPQAVENTNLQYAFGLTSGTNSFYSQDNPATTTTVVAELSSTVTVAAITDHSFQAKGGYRLPGGNRVTTGGGSVATRADIEAGETTYHITLVKQLETSDNSWVITVQNSKAGSIPVVIDIPKTAIGHDVYDEGAYIIAGSMNSTTTTLKVSNVTVTQPTTPDEPEYEAKWTKYTGNNAYKNGTVTEDATGLTLESAASKMAAAYYTQKVTVEEGTKISMDVTIPQAVENTNLQYAFGLTSGTNSFYSQDNPATTTTVVAELSSTVTVAAITDHSFQAKGGYRLPGGNRVTTGGGSAATREEIEAGETTYHITLVKQLESSDNSWVITVQNSKAGSTPVVIDIPKTTIDHDVYDEGAYIIAGSMNSTTTTLKVSNVTVSAEDLTPDTPQPPEDENAKWKVIEGVTTDGTLAENAEYNGDATFTNKIGAYYKEKIEIKDNSRISFKVKFPKLSSTEALHYGFSLIDTEGSFYTSNNTASSMSTEMQSSSTTNWAVAGVASKKIAPSSGRTFLANMGLLGAERNPADIYEIAYEKINETIGDINYSWKMTITNLSTNVKVSYKVKSADVAHNMFEKGAYVSVGVMNGNGYTMEISDLTIGTWEPEPETAWKPIRGYENMDFTKSTNDAITLVGGKGGAYRQESITLNKNMSITMEYEAKALTQKNSNDFYIMLLNKPASLANGAGDSGSGYALQMRTSADYSTFTLFMREVVNGKMGTDNTDATLKFGGGAINASALNQTVKVKFTRRLQEINGEVYYGSLTVNVAGKEYTKQIKLSDAERIFGNLDTELYLSAGCYNNIVNTVEIRNIEVSKLKTIQSVDGLWKPIYGYTEETLSAIVNKASSVELYGKGAAFLSNPFLSGTSNSIPLIFQMNGLTTNYHNKFGLAVLDQKSAFVGDRSSKGTGFVLEFRSFDQYEKGYAVYISTVTNGKADDFEKISDTIILGDMSQAKYDISLVRNNDGSWKIKVSDTTYSKTLSYTLGKCKALEALKPGNIYLSAGNSGMDMNAVIGY